MNISASWNSNSNANISSIIPSRLHHDKVDYIVSDVYKFIFGGIAGVSFLGNLFLCVVMCKKRSLLSKTYNLLLLNLAITDMLTGKYGRAFITRIVTELWGIDQMKPLSATVVLSLFTPSFRRSTASSGRTIKYLRYGFKRWRCHYKLA